MTSTLAALLLAHVAADFLLQTNAMVATKRRPGTLLLHGVIVLLTTQLALGRVDAWEPLALAAAHIVIDTIKAYALPARLASFLADQAVHVATILAVAIWSPTLYAHGLWASYDWLPAAMILVAGAITATIAGGHAVALLVSQWSDTMDNSESLENAGRWIGLLERGIIFILIFAGQPGGIGFLIAAKSVLRFDAERKQNVTEYVIIGTLASFGWAMTATWGTLWLMQTVPPLGFLPTTP